MSNFVAVMAAMRRWFNENNMLRDGKPPPLITITLPSIEQGSNALLALKEEFEPFTFSVHRPIEIELDKPIKIMGFRVCFEVLPILPERS